MLSTSSVREENLSDAEAIPPGRVVNVLQIIAEEDIGNNMNQHIQVGGGRSANLSKEPNGIRHGEQQQENKHCTTELLHKNKKDAPE